MFCQKCGTNLAEGSAFCTVCGTPTGAPQQTAAPTPNYQQPYTNGYQQPLANDGLSMQWFKFLINFALFAGAVLNAITAIQMFTGSIYEGVADLVYELFDGLQTLDMIYGIGCLAIAALGVYVRFRLAGFYANGPQMLNILYIAGLALSAIYLIGWFAVVSSEASEGVDISSFIISMGTNVAMIIANTTYFNKRKHLFTN